MHGLAAAKWTVADYGWRSTTEHRCRGTDMQFTLLICPSGKSREFVSSPDSKNISLRDLVETALLIPSCRPHKRGVSRSSRTLGAGCGGRGDVARRAN